MMNYIRAFSLKSKVVVVTGAAGLIGRSIIQALAQAGAVTIAADIDNAKGKKLEKSYPSGGKIVYRHFDITDLENLKKNIGALHREFDRIDAWVNSAYPRTADWGALVEEITVESWRKNVDMQLSSYALSSKYAAELMKKKGGAILNLGSIYGIVGGSFDIYEGTSLKPVNMIYATVKGGVTNMTRYLATYFGKYKIRVNAICPGGVEDGQPALFIKNYNKRVPLGRMAKPEDLAPAVLFLVSDAAVYVSGQILMVDGGWTAL